MCKSPPSVRVETPDRRPTTSPPGDVALSFQERELLSHVLEGHPNAEIARDLGISETAAKDRLHRLLHKIKVYNRAQATIWALANLPEFRDALGFI